MSDKTELTFEIPLQDGTVEIGKPCAWSNLEDIEVLQSKLLSMFIEEDTAIGSLIKPSNTEFWGYLEKMASLVPIVGKKELGFDPRKIESMDAICNIFITTQPPDPKSGTRYPERGVALLPSEIARVNYINFQRLLRESLEEPTKPQKRVPAKTKS